MKLRSLLLLAPVLALLLGGCGSDGKAGEGKPAATTDGHEGHDHGPGEGHGETPAAGDAKLKITDIKVGTGQTAANGDLLLMQYTGTLASNGSQFDSNDPEKKPESKPFSFVLGEGSVIKGWDQGLLGMKVGGERELLIPSSLGYGTQGQGSAIPPNADLKFVVKLLDIVKQGEEGVFDRFELKKGTGAPAKMGSKMTIHYTGKLVNGAPFDSSYDRKQPLEVELGKTRLIPGFTEGLKTMRQGGKYRLRIPPAIGYGPFGQPPSIPGNSVLIFEIDVLKVR